LPLHQLLLIPEGKSAQIEKLGCTRPKRRVDVVPALAVLGRLLPGAAHSCVIDGKNTHPARARCGPRNARSAWPDAENKRLASDFTESANWTPTLYVDLEGSVALVADILPWIRTQLRKARNVHGATVGVN